MQRQMNTGDDIVYINTSQEKKDDIIPINTEATYKDIGLQSSNK